DVRRQVQAALGGAAVAHVLGASVALEDHLLDRGEGAVEGFSAGARGAPFAARSAAARRVRARGEGTAEQGSDDEQAETADRAHPPPLPFETHAQTGLTDHTGLVPCKR